MIDFNEDMGSAELVVTTQRRQSGEGVPDDAYYQDLSIRTLEMLR